MPAFGGKLFGLGDANDDPRAAAMTRLFGVRDLVLAHALRHPEPAVRRDALRVGFVVDCVDCVDVVAGLIAWRSGAPRSAVLGVAGGAAAFAALGAVALSGEGSTAARG